MVGKAQQTSIRRELTESYPLGQGFFLRYICKKSGQDFDEKLSILGPTEGENREVYFSGLRRIHEEGEVRTDIRIPIPKKIRFLLGSKKFSSEIKKLLQEAKWVIGYPTEVTIDNLTLVGGLNYEEAIQTLEKEGIKYHGSEPYRGTRFFRESNIRTVAIRSEIENLFGETIGRNQFRKLFYDGFYEIGEGFDFSSLHGNPRWDLGRLVERVQIQWGIDPPQE